MATAKVNHWLRQIEAELRGAREDAVPPGFKCASELATETGFGRNKVQQILKEGVAEGRIERRNLRRLVGKQFRQMPYYAPIKPSKHS